MNTNVMDDSRESKWFDVFHVGRHLREQINRGMPEHVSIRFRVWWPLVLMPFAVVNQILAPHPVWLVLVISLFGMYGIAVLWVRTQAPHVYAVRQRTGAILVAGDLLREDFELRNNSRLPVIWAEFIDGSDLPGHEPGRIVACGAYSFYRWHTEVACERRGVYRLGPHRLRFGDPFGLISVEVSSEATDALLIYPRVVHLPDFELPHGNAGESRRRRRPLRGALPSASVVEYRPGDSLRHIHWRSTAKRDQLMVKELEIEPSGDVWIVLDMNRRAQSGTGPQSTLEYSVIVAASLAAKLLSEGERRAVGILAVSGELSAYSPATSDEQVTDDQAIEVPDATEKREIEENAVLVPPLPGQAQMWRILAALAPAEATNVTLTDLLHSSREVLGSRRTLVVITAQSDVDSWGEGYEHHAGSIGDNGSGTSGTGPDEESGASAGYAGRQNWLSELVHLRASGLDSSVLLIAQEKEDDAADAHSGTDTLRRLLVREDIPCQVLYTGRPLQPALTYRRTRRVVRSTPTGGVVTYDVEEDVG
jgi:uncharacterized protein (DUF58 family)